jgi:hypothetical protein
MIKEQKRAMTMPMPRPQRLAPFFQIVGIGTDDNDHLQDGDFRTYAQLPATDLGHFPGMMT